MGIKHNCRQIVSRLENVKKTVQWKRLELAFMCEFNSDDYGHTLFLEKITTPSLLGTGWLKNHVLGWLVNRDKIAMI